MIKTTTTISNKLGLHARASAKLTKLAGSFPCEVWMSRGERRVNAKSIMGVMMLAAGIGTEVSLETHGEREQKPWTPCWPWSPTNLAKASKRVIAGAPA
jgi:phosphocarrier protein